MQQPLAAPSGPNAVTELERWLLHWNRQHQAEPRQQLQAAAYLVEQLEANPPLKTGLIAGAQQGQLAICGETALSRLVLATLEAWS